MFISGIEIVYDLYNPTIQTIEVLKLEKRLDDNLTYLQDCPAEFSTVPFDFKLVKLPPGAQVPVNKTKVFFSSLIFKLVIFVFMFSVDKRFR